MTQPALILPTRNAERHIGHFLSLFFQQSLDCCLYIVDSSSSDQTVSIASKFGVTITHISAREFNHGGTRQYMVEIYPDHDIYIFMTQDAYLGEADSLKHLLKPFSDPKVGAVSGRQLPHIHATVFAQHARYFNYPAAPMIKSMADAGKLGIKTPFISNSFAAYRREALMQVGGFPTGVILSEDMYVAARMLLSGWKIAYTSDACCYHSHDYSLSEEFRRYFDQGVFHAREPWIRKNFGGAGGEGFNFVRSELHHLGWRRLHLWPYCILRNAFKLIGYKAGNHEGKLPVFLKLRLSMHKEFWRTKAMKP